MGAETLTFTIHFFFLSFFFEECRGRRSFGPFLPNSIFYNCTFANKMLGLEKADHSKTTLGPFQRAQLCQCTQTHIKIYTYIHRSSYSWHCQTEKAVFTSPIVIVPCLYSKCFLLNIHTHKDNTVLELQ